MEYSIGFLARKCRVGVETIRYYQRKGLLSLPPKRGGFRKYGERELKELTFIRNAKMYGWSLRDIKNLIRFRSKPLDHCANIQELVKTKIVELTAEIERLKELASKLEQAKTVCSGCEHTACGVIKSMESPLE